MMKVNSKELSAGLKKLSVAINNPSTPILANVRIMSGVGGVTIMGTNLNQEIKVNINCEVSEEIDTTINFKRLLAITNQLSDDVLAISIKDDTALLKCGKSKFKLSCINSSQWPVSNLEGDFKEFNLDYKSFRDQVNQVFYSASKDESRAVLNGVLFDFKDGDFKAVATDGRRLSISSIYGMQQEDLNLSFICPVPVLTDICRNGSDYVNIKVYDSRIAVKSGDYIVVSKIIEGNYPNYSQILPGGFGGDISINRVSFMDSVQRVSLILDDNQKHIKLEFKYQVLTVTAQTQDSASESFPVDFSGEAEFNFNPVFLVDMLKNVNGENVTLSYNDSTSPTQISCNNLKYIVMPMRG